VLDFDFIESGVESGSPKYMEWYSAFGLILTLGATTRDCPSPAIFLPYHIHKVFRHLRVDSG
jgi:hypothetical protein